MPRHATPSGRFIELGSFGGADLAERRVRMYVPRGPDEGTTPPERPLLVLFDGQNVFDDEGSYAGGWHSHRAVDRVAALRLVKKADGSGRGGILAPVIVAIDHGGPARIEELGAPSAAKLAALSDLIVDKVLPTAHEQVPLQQGPGGRYIGGSSLGGLAALYMHFHRPDVFGGALCMSPSFWYDNRGIFDFVAQEPNPYLSRIYLDAGGREARGGLTALVSGMANHLEVRGWSQAGDLRLLFRTDSKGTHNESHWRRRLPKALRFLVGP